MEQRVTRILGRGGETMSILSNGGTTWSTKLNRISQRSRQDHAATFNNIGHVISFEFLRDCFDRLEETKAIGADGISKEDYGQELSVNLMELLFRLRRSTYQPGETRKVSIPKSEGGTRELTISNFEDKLVQLAYARILVEIYEPCFLESSYGYRPNLGAHDALADMTQAMYKCRYGAIVEIDLKSYFDSVPLDILFALIAVKISDKRFLTNVKALLRGGRKGPFSELRGIPQGSIISPILSNIFLHHVLDEWFDWLKKHHFKTQCHQFRFADDVVFVFNSIKAAKAFEKALPKRLNKYGLKLNEAKSSIQPCGCQQLKELQEKKMAMPKFIFLGFQVSWLRSRKGFFRPRLRPSSKKITASIREIKEFLWRNLNAKDHMAVLKRVAQITQGWINYFALSDCAGALYCYRLKVRQLIHYWFNRRGKRGCMNWRRLEEILCKANLDMKFKIKSLFHQKTNTTNPEFGSPLP